MPVPKWTSHSKPQVSTCWIPTRKWHHDSFSGYHEYLWKIPCQSFQLVVVFQSVLKGPRRAGTRTRQGKTNVFPQTNKLNAQLIFTQHFLFEKAKDKHIVVPDILSILQHGQTDGALLISVQLLIIQTHLQVLGYSLQRDFNYCIVAGSWVLFVRCLSFFLHSIFESTQTRKM